MILVVDVTKGIQTQTAECLVIGEILCNSLVVVLNKIDLFPENQREIHIQRVTDAVRKVGLWLGYDDLFVLKFILGIE